MHELRINLDPCNPGQFYACCGVIELLELMGFETLSRFSLSESTPRRGQIIIASAERLSLRMVIDYIRNAEYVFAVRPSVREDKLAPVTTSHCGQSHTLDWWLDEFHDERSILKCWPGKGTSQDVVQTLRNALPSVVDGAELFGREFAAYTSIRFYVDPRSAWNALDLGYSAYMQGQNALTYPIVELLAAFGLQGFRPKRKSGLTFSYSLWESLLPLAVARTFSAQAWDSVASLTCEFRIESRGKNATYFSAGTMIPPKGERDVDSTRELA